MIRFNNFGTKLNLTATLTFTLLAIALSDIAIATPINNYQDPVIFHTVIGSDKYYNQAGKANFTLHLSPFYQHTHTANKPEETKTSNGNIWGPWNMAGLFLNNQPQPAGLTSFNATKAFLTNLQTGDPTFPYSKNYTNEKIFNPDEEAFIALRYQTVDTKYEKMGLRGQMSFDLGVGLGVAVKGGIVNMKNTPYPTSFTLDPTFAANAGLTPPTPTNPPTTPPSTPPALAGTAAGQAVSIYENLLGANARRQLFKDLSYDTSATNVTDLEDLFGNVYWHVPIKMYEKDEHTYSVIPYLSVGASLPMGKERELDKLFPVINSNDGFAGLTAEGAIALDFPDMMQLSLGGGLTMFNTRNLSGVHVPTSEFQSGVYPWSTTISRQPGPLWYINVSMKADNIMSKKDIPNFSCYFDYIYLEHKHDAISIKEPNPVFAKAFRPDLLERDSAWKAQMVHAGMKFGLSKNVYLTSSVQATLGGSRTYRPTTLLGGLIVSF